MDYVLAVQLGHFEILVFSNGIEITLDMIIGQSHDSDLMDLLFKDIFILDVVHIL